MARVKWTESMLKFVRENCHYMTDSQLALSLSSIIGVRVSSHSVRNLREEKGYTKWKQSSTKDPPTS